MLRVCRSSTIEKNKEESDSEPLNNWSKSIPIVDTMLSLATVDIQSGLVFDDFTKGIALALKGPDSLDWLPVNFLNRNDLPMICLFMVLDFTHHGLDKNLASLFASSLAIA